MSHDTSRHARSFGTVAEAYDRARPSFPRQAAAWLAGAEPAVVLELGAGTGKLTRELVALGHDVHASDPDPAMLAVLSRHLPDVMVSESGAEEIPLPDGSVDVVVAGQCFHWFDHERALPEIARVLRPGGRLALAWNYRDERIPWVRRLGALIGTQDQGTGPGKDAVVQPLVLSELFGFVEEATYSHWQQVDRTSIRELVLSRSTIAVLPEDERERRLAEVVAFYDEYGRGMDGMQLPYDCRCYRATVTDSAGAEHPADAEAEGTGEGTGGHASGGTSGGDPDDTDMLLIDFR